MIINNSVDKVLSDEDIAPFWLAEIAAKQACFFTAGLFHYLLHDKAVISLSCFSLVVFDEVNVWPLSLGLCNTHGTGMAGTSLPEEP